jgi:hypothetical protein
VTSKKYIKQNIAHAQLLICRRRFVHVPVPELHFLRARFP